MDALFEVPRVAAEPAWIVAHRDDWSTIAWPRSEEVFKGPAVCWWKGGGPHLLAVRHPKSWDEAAHLAQVWITACWGMALVGPGLDGMAGDPSVHAYWDGLLSQAATLEQAGKEAFEGAWEKAMRGLDKSLQGFDPQNQYRGGE